MCRHDLSHGSIFDIPITKDLLESVKLGKQRHNHHPENTRKFVEAKAEKLQKMTNKKKKIKEKVQQKLQELHSKVQKFSDGLAVANETKKLSFAENKQSKRTTKSTIQNRNWHHKNTGASEEQQVITKRIKDLEYKLTEIL